MQIEYTNKSPEDFIVECMTTEDAEYDESVLLEAVAVVMATSIVRQRAMRGQTGKDKLS